MQLKNHGDGSPDYTSTTQNPGKAGRGFPGIFKIFFPRQKKPGYRKRFPAFLFIFN